MDFIEEYLSRSQEIIGDRTRAEMRYDNEVVRWLRKGKEIKKSINKANKKYPNEALKLDGSNINDVASYYDYLLEHENILDACHEFLKPKRKPRSVTDLYIEFVMKGYLLFTEEDLYNALATDQRFIVENPCEDQHLAKVSVVRKKGKYRKT